MTPTGICLITAIFIGDLEGATYRVTFLEPTTETACHASAAAIKGIVGYDAYVEVKWDE